MRCKEYSNKLDKRFREVRLVCSGCNAVLAILNYDRSEMPPRCFGIGSVLKNGKLPKYCPNCGTAVEINNNDIEFDFCDLGWS